jgi:hypothetical protein
MRSLTAGYVARGWVVVRSGRDEQLLCPGDVGLYPYGARLEVRWDRIDQTVLRLSFDKR